MKNLQKLDDFQKLSKDNLIEEMMKDTIKGGCCVPTLWPDGTVTRDIIIHIERDF